MLNSKALHEQVDKYEAEAEAIFAKVEAEGRDTMTAEEKASFDAVIAKRDAAIDTLKSMDALNSFTKKEMKDEGVEADVKNMADFLRDCARGIVNTSSMSAGANGSIIPTSIADKIIDKIVDIAPVYAMATKYNVKGTLKINRVDASDDDVTVDFIDELTDPGSHVNKFSAITLTDYMYRAICIVSKKLINSTDFDIVSWLIGYIAKKVAKFMEKAIIKGKENYAEGIVAGVADSMKVTLASKDAITCDELIDIQDNIPDDYQNSCIWIMSKSTYRLCKKLKDGEGRYIFNYDPTTPFKKMILGAPVYVTDAMDNLGNNSKNVVLYADCSGAAVKEGAPLEIVPLFERYAELAAVGINVIGEMDAAVEDQQKFSMGVTPAATP